jgi:hypothetical protein
VRVLVNFRTGTAQKESGRLYLSLPPCFHVPSKYYGTNPNLTVPFWEPRNVDVHGQGHRDVSTAAGDLSALELV